MTSLAFISITAPVFALGAGLVVLPLIAHLFNRRTRQRIIFPSIDLLRAAAASQSSIRRLRRWWLLLLRCLAVLALVLAFMQPMWQSAQARSAADHGQAVVVVLDVSASTRQVAGGLPVIQTLRARAFEVLDALKPGEDRANLIFADANPTAAFPEMTGNPDALRTVIEEAEPTFGRADFAAAVSLAGTRLAQTEGPHRLVIISDMQQSNWQDALKQLYDPSPLPAGTAVTLLQPDAAPPTNLALHHPKTSPASPRVGQPCRFSVTVTNHSSRVQPATVRLTVSGQALPPQSLTLNPQEQREVTFTGPLNKPGEHRAEFSLTGDAFAPDDRCYLIASAHRQTPILLITNDDTDRPESAGYFLKRALAPFGDERDHFAVSTHSSSRLDSVLLAKASAVFIDNAGTLSETQADALLRYIEQGGGVIFFCSDALTVNSLAMFDSRLPDGVLPWRPVALREARGQGEGASIGQGDWQSSLLRRFDHTAQIALSNVPIYSHWTGAEAHPDARTLLKYDDGTPALVYRNLGAGRLAIANFSADPSQSDLGRHGLFVALMQGLADDLQPRTAVDQENLADRALTITTRIPIDREGPTPTVLKPDGRTRVEAALSIGDQATTFTIQRADAPGFYTAMQGDTLLGTAAVNLDAKESDLRWLNADHIAAAFEGDGRGNTSPISHDAGAVATLEIDLWGWVILLACVMLGTEMWLLGNSRS